MKLAVVVVCGSRSVARGAHAAEYRDRLWSQLNQWHAARKRATCTCMVMHGDCKDSPDQWADDWASRYNVQVMRLPAPWSGRDLSAGPRRNAVQADLADRLHASGAMVDVIACWDGESRGTRDAVDKIHRASGREIRVWWLKPDGGVERL